MSRSHGRSGHRTWCPVHGWWPGSQCSCSHMELWVSKEPLGPQECSPLSVIAYSNILKTDKSSWPIFSFVFHWISIVYLRCSVGILNGVGKLCNSVYLILIYRILIYFIFGLFFKLLWKTGHPIEHELKFDLFEIFNSCEVFY